MRFIYPIHIIQGFSFSPYRGQEKLGPHPDRSPFGVQFKISDEHPHPFHMRSPPPGCLHKSPKLFDIFFVSPKEHFV